MYVVGLISGTSADGIDAAVVELDGAPPTLEWTLLAATEVPFDPQLSEMIFAAFRPETATVDRLCALNFYLGDALADAALTAIDLAGLHPQQVDLIGSHGQTVWHIPEGPDASTLQLGEAAVIAERTGITTVSNFRTRDMAAGGQGAPLVSFVDALLLRDPIHIRVAQNIGGIGNLTFLPPSGDAGSILAFDTGPGNMLIDDAVLRMTGGAMRFDEDGRIAASGTVSQSLLRELLAHPYYAQRPPKTTGREEFGRQYGGEVWRRAQEAGLAAPDIVATVTALTAESIAHAYRAYLPVLPHQALVSGGGARNATLLRQLASLLPGTAILTTDDVGLPSSAKEAVAFAVLAYETWHQRPGNLPAATGARRRVVLGNITPI